MYSKTTVIRPAALALAAMMVLSACATGPIVRAERHIAQDQWLKAVIEYRKAFKEHPDNIEYKSRLKQTELKAADYYYQQGLALLEQGNFDAAIVQYQQGLAAMPQHSKLQQAIRAALAQKEADTLFREGIQLQTAGKVRAAGILFQRALKIYPDHKEAQSALAKIQRQEEERDVEKLALSSRSPVTLNFHATDLRTAFDFIAKSFGINVIFDEAVKSIAVTLFAKDVTFSQALNLLLATTKTFYKRIGPNTILIAPDSKDKRGQYEDHIVRTFTLTTIPAKEMGDIIKGILTVKKLIINEQLNSLIVRDTKETLKLIEKLIAANDRKPAEMILDVEILEVNRTKLEQIGLDFGSYQISASVPPYPLTQSFSEAKESGTLTIPSLTLRFFKQDVDAKTLANPKIRVLNGKKATIHVGDRVPLRSSSIVDATGQVRTTFTYTDIGIKLSVEPTIHLDNSATVKLGLEVSTLGPNLGTTDDPAFQIGTRNADTFMLLRDGETAILGGLIRDEERKTRIKLPGLGDIPVIGSIFTARDDSSGRTDVLLTITPRIVRAWDPPEKEMREFYSGTEKVYSDKPLFAYLETPASRPGTAEARAEIAVGDRAAGETTPSPAAPAVDRMAALRPRETATGKPMLTFSEPVYETASGEEFEIRLVGANLAGITGLSVEVLFNPQFLEFVRGETGDFRSDEFEAKADSERGLLRISLPVLGGTESGPEGVLGRIFMRGVKPGISYLVYKVPSLKNVQGETVRPQVRASRVVVR